MIFRTYLNSNDETEYLFIHLSNIFTIVFSIIFVIEIALQCITNRLVLEKRSYLRDFWNILDFALAFSYIVDIFTSDQTDSDIIKV